MSTEPRIYTTRRLGIVNALVEEFKKINGSFPYQTHIYERVEPRLIFWDEVNEFPTINVSAGPETRSYQGGGYKDRFMTVTIRAYVKQDDSIEALEGLIEDIETVLEESSRIAYKDRTGATQFTQLITIASIDTDAGVLAPFGVGEIVCEVRY